MNEIEPLKPEHVQDLDMDRFLRRSLAAPIPTLPPDFDRRVLSTINQTTQSVDRGRRIVFIGYGLSSALVSAIILRGQGLNWGLTSSFILGPAILLAAGRMKSPTGRLRTKHS